MTQHKQYTYQLIHFPPFDQITLKEISIWFDKQSAEGWNPVGMIEDLIIMQKEKEEKETKDGLQTKIQSNQIPWGKLVTRVNKKYEKYERIRKLFGGTRNRAFRTD